MDVGVSLHSARTASVSGRVTSITYAPVKGLALAHVDEVELELTGVRDNRRFHLIDDDGRLVNGKVAGTLVQVAAERRPRRHDARRCASRTARCSRATSSSASRSRRTSRAAGRRARLVEGRVLGARSRRSPAGRSGSSASDEPGAGSDRGVEGSVSVVSTRNARSARARGR